MNLKGQAAERSMPDSIPTHIGADFQPGMLESSLHWQVIWPRIIAKCWEDGEFHEEIKKDARKAIAKHFGYALSTNLALKIKDAPASATFESEDNNPYTPDDPWAKLPPLELTLVIPPAPEPGLQAVAITAYQDTGRTYPFTCC
jgi:ribosomally synthesized peptide (two-chain TOMM family)